MRQLRTRRLGSLAPLLILSLAAIGCGPTGVGELLGSEASAPNGGSDVAAAASGQARSAPAEMASTRTTAPRGPVSWEEAPTLHIASGPWTGCAVKRFDSGWIVGRCGNLELFVQAGFAATIGPITQRGVAGDRLGGYVHPRSITVDGRDRPGADIVRRERMRVETVIGDEMRPDRNGRILHRGLHARLRTPASGAVGVTCHADLADYDEGECVRLLERAARQGLPGGAVRDRALTVAGVSLSFAGERCWSPGPDEVYCFLDGGMHFARGSTARMNALREESIRQAPLAPRSEEERRASADRLNANRERIHMLTMVSELERTGQVSTTEAPVFEPEDFPRMRVERHDGSCRIGGVVSACTRMDYYGALEHVANYAYYARVPRAEGETLVHCSHHHDESASSPCRQVFGDFVVPSGGGQ